MKFAYKYEDITPKEPIIQSGYVASRDRVYDYVNDPIETHSICMTINNEKYVWTTVDFTGLEIEVVEEIKAKVKEVINPDHVIINVSHTHCGPASNRELMGKMVQAPESYIQYYEEKIAKSIIDACNDEGEEVATKIATFTIDGIYSNRNNINKPSNKNVYIIGYFKEDKLVGMALNMSHHCTVLGPDFYGLSADLFGCLRKSLREKYGCPVLVIQGTAGDMGNRQYRQGNDYNEVIRETKNLMEQIAWRLNWQDINLENVEIKQYKYHASYYHDASVYVEKIKDFENQLETETDYDRCKLLNSGIAGFKRKMAVASGQYEKDMPYQIWNMGELQLITIPGEYGSYLALKVLAASKAKHCMIWGYSNSTMLNYMVEKEAYEQFAHEVNVTTWPAGICDEYTEDIIKNL